MARHCAISNLGAGFLYKNWVAQVYVILELIFSLSIEVEVSRKTIVTRVRELEARIMLRLGSGKRKEELKLQMK